MIDYDESITSDSGNDNTNESVPEIDARLKSTQTNIQEEEQGVSGRPKTEARDSDDSADISCESNEIEESEHDGKEDTGGDYMIDYDGSITSDIGNDSARGGILNWEISEGADASEEVDMRMQAGSQNSKLNESNIDAPSDSSTETDENLEIVSSGVSSYGSSTTGTLLSSVGNDHVGTTISTTPQPQHEQVDTYLNPLVEKAREVLEEDIPENVVQGIHEALLERFDKANEDFEWEEFEVILEDVCQGYDPDSWFDIQEAFFAAWEEMEMSESSDSDEHRPEEFPEFVSYDTNQMGFSD